MSDPKRIDSTGEVTVLQHQFVGMVTIRTDLSDGAMAKKIEKITGHAVPEQRKVNGDVTNGLAWMSPDELLCFCIDPAALVKALNAALSGHALVVDVSHSRAVFALQGDSAREVLAKGAPIDLSHEAFKPNDFRRTRLGQVAVAFWQDQESPDSFGLVCFSSVQEFVFDWLVNASQKSSMPRYLT